MTAVKNKRILCVLLLTALLIAVTFIGRTLAYTTDSEKQENKVSFANVKAEIREPNFDPEHITLDQTTEFTKDICVENTGTAPCFVRVYLDFSDSEVRSCSTLSQDGSVYLPYADYPPSGDWEKGSDGYFYYKKLLPAGESTSYLVQKIKTEFPSGVEPYAYDIVVYSEAVQAVATDGTVYSDNDYLEAFTGF